MVKKCGVAAEIASKSLSVRKLFLLPVCVFDILRCRCLPTSGRVVSGRFESGVVENVGVAAEIASKSLFVQKLFPLPVSGPPFWIPVVGIFDVLVRCQAYQRQ